MWVSAARRRFSPGNLRANEGADLEGTAGKRALGGAGDAGTGRRGTLRALLSGRSEPLLRRVSERDHHLPHLLSHGDSRRLGGAGARARIGAGAAGTEAGPLGRVAASAPGGRAN